MGIHKISCEFVPRILVRAISYTVHGLIPASCVFADRYNREEVVRSLGKEVNINPPLMLGQLPDTPEELLKLDQVRVVLLYISFRCTRNLYLFEVLSKPFPRMLLQSK